MTKARFRDNRRDSVHPDNHSETQNMHSPVAANVLGTIGAVSYLVIPCPSLYPVRLANWRVDLLVCPGQSSIHGLVCYDPILKSLPAHTPNCRQLPST